MGKSCTKAAGLALAKAEKALCIGRSSNLYRLDDLTPKGLQVIIESWEEQDDGGCGGKQPTPQVLFVPCLFGTMCLCISPSCSRDAPSLGQARCAAGAGTAPT